MIERAFVIFLPHFLYTHFFEGSYCLDLRLERTLLGAHIQNEASKMIYYFVVRGLRIMTSVVLCGRMRDVNRA